ncbi:unnamed protein product [Arabis nemorensis]|uniref:Uncharacterized protein n=1 Tax=Arabis nemorensis TaxID=586526 RepID=A0A565ANG1_9BRAS|nr:unnamed protein product [Arabis nemorensis]
MASRKEALRVERPKRHETTKMENTLKMIPEEGKFEVDVDAGDVKPALRNSEIFKDVANNYYQSTVKPPVKMKKEISPEEMDRKFEAFIKKVKKERRESLRLDKEMA